MEVWFFYDWFPVSSPEDVHMPSGASTIDIRMSSIVDNKNDKDCKAWTSLDQTGNDNS